MRIAIADNDRDATMRLFLDEMARKNAATIEAGMLALGMPPSLPANKIDQFIDRIGVLLEGADRLRANSHE